MEDIVIGFRRKQICISWCIFDSDPILANKLGFHYKYNLFSFGFRHRKTQLQQPNSNYLFDQNHSTFCDHSGKLSGPAVQQFCTLYPEKQTANLFQGNRVKHEPRTTTFYCFLLILVIVSVFCFYSLLSVFIFCYLL